MKKLLCALLCLCLCCSAALAEITTVFAGDFTLDTPGGEAFTLSDHEGKVILLNFWATWCGPCVYEMPAINELAAHYAGAEDVVIVCVNCGDLKSVASAFLREKGFDSLKVVCDTRMQVSTRYEVDAIPRTMIFDKNGALSTSYVGVPMEVEKLCAHYIELIEGLR